LDLNNVVRHSDNIVIVVLNRLDTVLILIFSPPSITYNKIGLTTFLIKKRKKKQKTNLLPMLVCLVREWNFLQIWRLFLILI